ncbi:uncharacterized protein PV09_00949 [Verruconis gallopava]|uniref:Zn(2)-C6 fungal-type domain-containing protein n=1 Tax=Verruconis gallopava TaxID=253628 RepID=A0A0D2AMU2_9PEZI|nr:uncharacterized protein PV09_00949 [Verruconis gallopava]KIW08003.1 hypothetical protein PV09_00949 [Verruconis gallopava]
MPKDQYSSSRQRPVSCTLCRKRKLRCSRDAPCSNCVSRAVPCDLEEKPKPYNAESSQSEIIERLGRLEQLLAGRQSEQASAYNPIASTWKPRETAVQPSLTRDASSQVQSLNQDVALLESIYLGDIGPNTSEIPSSRVMYKTCSVERISQAKQWFCGHDLEFSTQSVPVRCIWLPTYAEAQTLLQKYTQVAAHFPWITYLPSLPEMLEEIYTAQSHKSQIKPGPLVLALAIFACATSSWTSKDCETRGLYNTVQAAAEQSRFWIDAAQDLVDISREYTTLSIEGISGSVLLSFLLVHLEGFTRKCRYLFSHTIWMARNLGLHRLDHPNSTWDAESVETEIARRVFWYICSCDWQAAARFDGADEGVYTFHPRQIITRLPKHSDDDNVLVELPLSIPTTMSYPLHRIKLSEICRRAVDRNPLASANLGGISHDALMDTDAELQALLNEVQLFFSLPQDELARNYRLHRDKAADIVQQGHTLRFLLHGLRCKLHIPFLIKGYTTSAFAESKDICVMSARLLIQSQSHLLEMGSLNGTMFPFCGLLLGVFMANVVLIVDLCMGRSKGRDDLHREEICKAFRLLESARHESETTARFVDSLTQILQKHKIRSPKEALQSMHANQRVTQGDSTLSRLSNRTCNALMTPDSSVFTDLNCGRANSDETVGIEDQRQSTYFINFAKDFEEGTDMFDNFDWDNIFSDLNTMFA